jgi:hypothetical protein
MNILHVDLEAQLRGSAVNIDRIAIIRCLEKGQVACKFKYHIAVRILPVEDDQGVLLFVLKGARG